MVGLPVGLVAAVGNPVPRHLATWAQVQVAVQSGNVSSQTLLRALSVVVWLLWSYLAVSAFREAGAAVRAHRSGRPVVGGQRWIGRLVVPVVSAVFVVGGAGMAGPAVAAPQQPAAAAAAPVSGIGARGSTAEVSGVAAATQRVAQRHTAAVATAPTARSAAAAAATSTAREATVSAGSVHVVLKGDTLWGVSAREMHDPTLWPTLFAENRGKPQPGGLPLLTDPHWIYPGQDLVVPAARSQGTTSGPSASSTAGTSSSTGGKSTAAPAAGAAGATASTAAASSATGANAVSSSSSPASAPSSAAAAQGAASGSGGATGRGGSPATAAPTGTGTATDGSSAPVAAVGDAGQSPSKTAGAGRRGPSIPLLPAGLVAGGVLAAVLAVFLRRRRRQMDEAGDVGEVGGFVSSVSDPVEVEERRRVERAAEIGADFDGAEFFEVAMLHLGAGLRAAGIEPPEIVGAELHPDALVVLLAEPAEFCPDGFATGVDDPLSWVLARPADLGELSADETGSLSPLPLMVSVGMSGDVEVFVNPEAVGVIAFDGEDDRSCLVAREVVASVAVELAAAPWSRGAQLYLVGFGQVDGLGEAASVTVVAAAEDCLPALEAGAAARRQEAERVSMRTASAVRVLGHGSGLPGPVLVLCLEPPAAGALAKIAELAADPLSGVALVMAGDPQGGATLEWVLEVDEDGQVDVGPLGWVVDAHRLSAEVLDVIEGFVAGSGPGGRPMRVVGDEELSRPGPPTTRRVAEAAGDEELTAGPVEAGPGLPVDPTELAMSDVDGGGEAGSAGTGSGVAGVVAAVPGSVPSEVSPVAGDGGGQSQLRALRAVREMVPDLPAVGLVEGRRPDLLVQLMRPSPRVIRLTRSDGAVDEVVVARGRSLEAIGYLGSHGGEASSATLGRILHPEKASRGLPHNAKTFSTDMSVARRAMGVDAAGADYLSTKVNGDGRFRLAGSVALDWDVFRRLVTAAEDTSLSDAECQALLQAALNLVGEGRPFEDVLKVGGNSWRWVETESNLRHEIDEAIVDAAQWLAEVSLANDDFKAAAAAIGKGLSVRKLDGKLNGDRLELELRTNGPDACRAAFAVISESFVRSLGEPGATGEDLVDDEVRSRYSDLVEGL
jgi:LysM repeat protein